jgi:nicotinamidase-related amidase
MKNKALLVIDVQNGMFLEGEEVFNGNRLLQGIQELIKQVRSANMPVLYIQHNESAGFPWNTGLMAGRFIQILVRKREI